MGDVMDSTLMHINKENPLSARESKGNPPTNPNSNDSILLAEFQIFEKLILHVQIEQDFSYPVGRKARKYFFKYSTNFPNK